jgi:hypothetical protein
LLRIISTWKNNLVESVGDSGEAFNLQMPLAPFCGVWMTVILSGRKIKASFHSTICGIAFWASCAPHPVEKSMSLYFYKNKFCKKKKTTM